MKAAMKLLGSLLIVGILTVCLVELSLAEDKTDNKFVIGAILPLSGSGASIGGYIRNGMELAYQELSAENKNKIELVFEDDGWQPRQAVSAYQRLVQHKKIDAVIVVGSAIGNAVSPLAEKNKTPLIAVGASDFNVAKDKQYSFIHWITPESEASVMAKEIAKRNYQRIAIVSCEQEGVIAVYDSLISDLAKANLKEKIVLDQRYFPADTDFRTFVAKAKTEKIDAIVVMLLPGSIASFAKQVKTSGLKVDLAGMELFEDENEVKASDGALIGHWFVNADNASSDFEKIYKKAYGDTGGFGAANSYDAFNLLVGGYLETNGSADEVSKFVATVKDYHGAAGNYSATGDHRFTLPVAIKVVTKTGFEKIP